MPLKIATWNINSVRLRADMVSRFLQDNQPDILCLQEIKCRNTEFPAEFFAACGYPHFAVNGQLGYHGVATLSRIPFLESSQHEFCGKGDSRHQAVTIKDGRRQIVLHNFYVPAGGDEPDPEINEKFAHKLAFLAEMRDWLGDTHSKRSAVLVGDLNVAPLENDVWSHKQMLKVVSHTPVETQALELLRESGDWVDAMRHFVPASEKLYTWWSYRAADWASSDRGRRLDHVWVTPPLAKRLERMEIIRHARGWERPSDHVPVMVQLAAP